MEAAMEAGTSSGRGLARARVRWKIWIERDGEVLLSEWRIALLRGVRETGSLAKAAERLDVPYRTAWQRIQELEARLGVPLLETESGGTTGGGSRLTDNAIDLIARFEQLTEGIGELVEKRMRAEFGDRV
jgi:molybdate transport system regulatory protein